MLKKSITYTTFLGEEITDAFYFNYTQEEIVKINMIGAETIEGALVRLTEERNNEKIYEIVTGIVKGAVGRPSEDGRRFVKTPEILADFLETNAYSDFMVELLFGENPAIAVAEFVNGIIPEKAKKNLPGGKITPEMITDYKIGKNSNNHN